MRVPAPAAAPLRGDTPIKEEGFSYLPRYLSVKESQALVSFFASLQPIWETRHGPGSKSRRGGSGRLTRPVYWLGAWQFACLGYYSEPDYTAHRAVRAEPLPPVMQALLERLRPVLGLHNLSTLPNTCLINYYGRERPDPKGPPVDYARLRMHRDTEPGAVVMLSVGQPAQFEFVRPEGTEPELSLWVRNRSVVVMSGAHYKDDLYHRVTRVRYGDQPVLSSQLEGFEVRRVSVSFRYVPEQHIADFAELPVDSQKLITPYLERLAVTSEHFRRQLSH